MRICDELNVHQGLKVVISNVATSANTSAWMSMLVTERARKVKSSSSGI